MTRPVPPKAMARMSVPGRTIPKKAPSLKPSGVDAVTTCASRIVVRGLLPGTGEEVVLDTDAFEARALQHELDHLDGFLFLDRVVGPHAVFPRKTYL